MRIAHDKAPPFDPLIPNAETIAAMREAREGNLPRFNPIEELMAALMVKASTCNDPQYFFM
jgi:DNA-damage-inducible protein J